MHFRKVIRNDCLTKEICSVTNFNNEIEDECSSSCYPLMSRWHANVACMILNIYTGVYNHVSPFKSVFISYSSKSDTTSMSLGKNVQSLFDFTRDDRTDHWSECSDTKNLNGTSKATFVIQKTKLVQRAILFTLLNSKPEGGSSYASVNCEINTNLSDYRYIAVKCRGQGINKRYKILLKHAGVGKDAIVHGQIFEAPDGDFGIIKLPLLNFKPYFRGQQLPIDSYNLNLSSITHFGIKIDNGSFLPENKLGVSVLEIDWIKATK